MNDCFNEGPFLKVENDFGKKCFQWMWNNNNNKTQHALICGCVKKVELIRGTLTSRSIKSTASQQGDGNILIIMVKWKRQLRGIFSPVAVLICLAEAFFYCAVDWTFYEFGKEQSRLFWNMGLLLCRLDNSCQIKKETVEQVFLFMRCRSIERHETKVRTALLLVNSANGSVHQASQKPSQFSAMRANW